MPLGTSRRAGRRGRRRVAARAATETGPLRPERIVSMSSLFDELPTQDRQTFARWLMESERVEVLATHPSGGTAYEFERFDATMQALEHPDGRVLVWLKSLFELTGAELERLRRGELAPTAE